MFKFSSNLITILLEILIPANEKKKRKEKICVRPGLGVNQIWGKRVAFKNTNKNPCHTHGHSLRLLRRSCFEFFELFLTSILIFVCSFN